MLIWNRDKKLLLRSVSITRVNLTSAVKLCDQFSKDILSLPELQLAKFV